MDLSERRDGNEINESRRPLNIERIFSKEIRKFSLLTAEEEKELSKLIQEKGDKDALNKLVECNLRFARLMAGRYLYTGVPFLDLVQAASLGLIKAAERFDHRRNKRFATYAYCRIRRSIQEECQNYDLIACPPEVKMARNKILRTIAQYKLKKGRGPSPEELSAILAMSPEKIEKLLGYVDRREIRLDDFYDPRHKGDESSEYHDVIGDAVAPTPEQIFSAKEELQEMSDNLDIMLDALSRGSSKKIARDKSIFLLRYGLNDGLVGSTLDKIGAKYNITKERARQIVDKGWAIIRRRCASELIARKWTREQIKELDEKWMKKELRKIDCLIRLGGLTPNLFTQGLRE